MGEYVDPNNYTLADNEWKARNAVSARENTAIRDACTRKTLKKGRMTTDFHASLYTQQLTAASVVFPDLKNAELQRSYGVVGEVDLLGVLLLPGETTTLQEYVQQVNGFDPERLEREMDEVKNS